MNANLDPRVKVNTELMFVLVTNNCHCLIRIWEVFFFLGVTIFCFLDFYSCSGFWGCLKQ